MFRGIALLFDSNIVFKMCHLLEIDYDSCFIKQILKENV